MHPDLWHLSQIAYDEIAEACARYESLGFSEVTPLHLEGDHVESYLLVDGAHGFLVVAGSDDGWDWGKNFLAFPAKSDLGGLVHAGFESMARDVFRVGLALARKGALADLESLTIVGHSLGGAIAIDVAQRVKRWLLEHGQGVRLEVITFGCPRLGNEQYCALWESLGISCCHYQHPADPVPWLPLWWRLPGRVQELEGEWSWEPVRAHRLGYG